MEIGMVSLLSVYYGGLSINGEGKAQSIACSILLDFTSVSPRFLGAWGASERTLVLA